jgi:hypothetical protein
VDVTAMGMSMRVFHIYSKRLDVAHNLCLNKAKGMRGMKPKFLSYLFLLTVILIFSSCSSNSPKISLLDVKMAKGVDEKLLPVDIVTTFPAGTSKVFCWFKWNSADIDIPINASWYFVTDNIHILDYSFNIPRKEGSGSVSLTMPEGKDLPPGTYRVDLKKNRRILRSLTFTVLEN